MTYTAAIAQIDSRVGDVVHNLKVHVNYTQKALEQGAQLIIFPELSSCGYFLRDIVPDVVLFSFQDTTPFKELRQLSKKITIILGGVEESEDIRFYNSAFMFENGEMRSVHRKLYLPTYGMFEENRYFLPGKKLQVIKSKLGNLGVLVCEDLWHIVLPYLLAIDGAQVIVGMSASPTKLGGDEGGIPAVAEVNMDHHKTYARLLSVYMLFSNRVGFEDGINFWGGSSIISPDGSILHRAPFFEEKLIISQLSRNEIRRARIASRHILDDDPSLTLDTLRRINKSRQ